MLKSLDILIGLSVVMLIVSMAVTLINQAILNALAKRGRCLRDGIADLVQHLDWKMPRQTAEDVAAVVLTQPSIRKTTVAPALGALFPSRQFGEVIHREELTKILLGLGPLNDEIQKGLSALEAAIHDDAAGATQQAASALTSAVQRITGARSELLQPIVDSLEQIRTGGGGQAAAFKNVKERLSAALAPLEAIVSVLKDNGISDPGKTLDNVRSMSLQLERSNPEQASDLRHSTALLQEASSPFLAKINFAFDQTMDRVSERYTYNARVVTLVSAALVALALQLDTVYLFNRLSMDDKMRDALVAQAAKVVADEEVANVIAQKGEAKDQTAAAAAGASAPEKPDAEAPAKNPSPVAAQDNDPAAEAKTKYYLSFLAQQGVIRLPASLSDWKKAWKDVNPAGVLLSILLLSLGAPFWYNAIGKLLQFRSLLAQKDDQERLTRQTTQPPPTPAKAEASSSSSPAAQGERGDLNAVA